MYNPYDENNYNQNNDMQGQNPQNGQTPLEGQADQNSYGQQGQADQNTYGQQGYGNQSYNPNNTSGWSSSSQYNPGNTTWQGSSYHSGPVYPPYQDPTKPPKAPKPKKDRSKLKKNLGRAVACVAICCVVSVSSIAGFVGLVNGGYISLGSGSGDGAFQITKYVNADGTTANSSTGQLTAQEIAKKVTPAVVCIQNYQVQQNASGYVFGGRGQQQQQQEESELSPASEGSGIIATSDGYIITNAHVVEGATDLKVILSDGKQYEATLVGSDSVTDLAIIKVDATGLPAAEFGASEDLQVGDEVLAIGNPGGSSLSSTVTFGHVSALNREITSENGYTMNCIQTDAAINPGNSGGALVNMRGQVIGINSAKISATGYEGLGFSIPITDAQPIITSLKENGYVKDRAMLGITCQYIDSMAASFYGLPTSGLYVSTVSNESMISAGIQEGCIITKIDGETITSQAMVTNLVNSKKPGDTVTLDVLNALTGKSFTATITLAQSTGK